MTAANRCEREFHVIKGPISAQAPIDRFLSAPRHGHPTTLELRLGPAQDLQAPRRNAWSRQGDGPPISDTIESISRVSAARVTLEGIILRPADADKIPELLKPVPRLSALSLFLTRAPLPAEVEAICALKNRCHERGLSFAVEFALDENADAYAALRGSRETRSASLAPILLASRDLRRRDLAVCWLIPISAGVVYRLEALFSLARDEGIDPVLLPPWMVRREPLALESTLVPDELLFAWDFVTYRLLQEEEARHSPARSAYYRSLAGWLLNAQEERATRTMAILHRAQPSAARFWDLKLEDRPLVTAQASWKERLRRMRAAKLLARALELFGVLFDGARGLARWIYAFPTGHLSARKHGGTDQRFSRVMAIGAYGGEHIGDIAILGGVLLRISKRYGATHAVLMSQRARHTRHLVPMLDSAVSVTVESYEAQRIRAHLPQVDALVYAGGPLMDIPKQLVKHLYAVSIARRMGKPFIVEGIGAGPFKRLLSAWSARRTVRMARSITLRTRADNETRLVRHLDREVGHDPAFDYLATRPAVLTRLRDSDRNWLDVLLENAADTLTVGVNLRPIRPFFTEGVPAPRRLAHTRAVEQRFERQLAEGLREFSRTSNKPPRFIFFPMNAIQAGMSDLRSAYRLFRLLGGEIDFRVWEGDASLDGVISLLRRLDIVISMRFHATIFALSQGCRVIGVDYRIGERDKVAALLEDFGQADNCRRIDQLTADWLASRLSILSRQPARAHPTSDDVSAR